MMKRSDTLFHMEKNVLASRRNTIAKELERLRKEIADYEAELAEIEEAERVIARYSSGSMPMGAKVSRTAIRTLTGSRPIIRPGTSQLILDAIKNANRSGHYGLSPSEIYREISKRGWSINRDTMRGTIFKMASEQKLVRDKESGVYSLPIPDGQPDS